MGIHEKEPNPLPPVDVERDDVVLVANRCPFCHTDVDAEAGNHLVCRGCLARHHEGCWEEAGACSACGGSEALVAREQPTVSTQSTVASPVARLAILIALFVVMLVAGAVMAFVLSGGPT